MGRILLIEDDASSRAGMARLLRSVGDDVYECSPEETDDYIGTGLYDLILCTVPDKGFVVSPHDMRYVQPEANIVFYGNSDLLKRYEDQIRAIDGVIGT